ncbi:MAG: hydroxymethylglutaryl-CoA lyase [Phycisphaerales bacterium]
MSAHPYVRLCEVGPRDGLQNERTPVPTEAKVAFVDALSAAGFPEIEVSSFVSAKRVPQLGDAAEVFARIARWPGTVYSALVPNERGMESALAARVGKVSVFAAASEGFSRANTGGTIDEVIARFGPVVRMARAAGLPVRGYVSCVVRCPYDGATPPQSVRAVVERLLAAGIDEIDLGETLGVAVPDDLARLLEGVAPAVDPGRVTLHLHDSNGRGAGHPDPVVVVSGHSHKGGAWQVRGRLIVNTGSFTFPGRPHAATIGGDAVTLAPLVRRAGEWGQDAASARTWRIADVARATAARSTPAS